MKARLLPSSAFVALSLLLVAAVPAAAQTAPSPQEIIDSYKAAVGGDAAENVAEMRTNGTVAIGGLNGTIVTRIDRQNGYSRTDIDLGALKFSTGNDAQGSWVWRNGNLQSLTGPAALKTAITDRYLQSNAWFRPDRGGAALTYLGSVTIEGATADRVRIAPVGGVPFEADFDRATHYLVASIDVDPETNITHTDRFTNYQKFGNAYVPLGFRSSNGDARFDIQGTTTQVDLSAPLVLSDFSRPGQNAEAQMYGGRSRTSVPIRFPGDVGSGHVVVRALVDGHPLNLIFDSGGNNVLTPEAAGALGVQAVGKIPVGGAGSGFQTASVATVKEVRVGDAALKDQPFIVVPLPEALVHETLAYRIDGLIGYEFMRNFVTTIDYKNKRLTFTQAAAFVPPPHAVKVPFTTNGHIALIQASIDGHAGTFQVDTGNGSFAILFPEFAKSTGLDALPSTPSMTAALGLGGESTMRLSRAHDLIVAGLHFPRPYVILMGNATGGVASTTEAGNLSATELSAFALTLDFAHSILYFTPQEHPRAYTLRSLGLFYDLSPQRELRVAAVQPGSAAQKAGIARGDRVVKLDGIDAQSFGPVDATLYQYSHPTVRVTYAHDGKMRQVTLHVQPILP